MSLLGIKNHDNETLVPRKDDWDKHHNIHDVFSKLLELDDASVSKILTFVIAETLECGSELVEVLGNRFTINMADYWKPDEAFFTLLRDKSAINAMVKEAAGKITADAHITSTAKVQKKVIQNCLNGTRKGKEDWQPRYMNFPMKAYTKNGGILAIDHWKSIKKKYAA